MENEQINNIVDSAVSSISRIAEINNVIGKPIVTMDGSTILPISQITFGFMAGGGEYGNKVQNKTFIKDICNNNFAGGTGGGATLTPMAFLVVNKDGIKLLDVDNKSTIEKMFDVAKDIANSFGGDSQSQ